MPIIEFKDSLIHQHCAACEAERDIPASELLADALIEGLPAVLKLPRCTCGATEHLIHSPLGEPPHPLPGTFGHLHRLIVDALLDVVADAPEVTEPLASRVIERLGATVVEQWFPSGLRTIPAPAPGATTTQAEKEPE